MFVVKNTVPSIKSTEQLEAVIALAHAATLERISSPIIAEENEGIENCIPMEDSSKVSEAEVGSCDNDISQILEHKGEVSFYLKKFLNFKRNKLSRSTTFGIPLCRLVKNYSGRNAQTVVQKATVKAEWYFINKGHLGSEIII